MLVVLFLSGAIGTAGPAGAEDRGSTGLPAIAAEAAVAEPGFPATAAARARLPGSNAGRRLSEAELDAVTAGDVAVNEAEDVLSFEGVKRTASGRRIGVDGSLEVIEVPTGITVGNLVLSDGAQQNLQSVININAVNSAVNVLLNLNITIDSSVGDINQLNLTESLPAIPAGLPPGR